MTPTRPLAAAAALAVSSGATIMLGALIGAPGSWLTGYVSEAGTAGAPYATPYRAGLILLAAGVVLLGGAVRRPLPAILLAVAGVLAGTSAVVPCSNRCPLPPYEPTTVSDVVHTAASIVGLLLLAGAMVVLSLTAARPAAHRIALTLTVLLGAALGLTMLLVGRGPLGAGLERVLLVVAVSWLVGTSVVTAVVDQPRHTGQDQGMSTRWGMTVPLAGVPLADHAAVFSALADAGFTDVWSAEVSGTDAFTPLTLAAAWEPRLRLGTAVTPVFTRGPGLLAMTAAALAETAPGRFRLGIGASSPVVVGDWNAAEFTAPYARSRDMLRFLRAALAGETVDGEFTTFRVRRFRLERPPATPPRVLLAALRPGMLRLAAAEADGVILNWLAASDVPAARAELTAAGPDFEVVARIFVCPTSDAGYARTLGRRMIAAYLTVPAYAEFHRWLGREPQLGEMWRLWAAGDRKGALAAIPDAVVDQLIVHGSPAECREQVRAYANAGVEVPVIALLATPELEQGGAPALLRVISALGPPDSAPV